jgi:hypothetical protein
MSAPSEITEERLQQAASKLPEIDLQRRALLRERTALMSRLDALRGPARVAFQARKILAGRGPRPTTPEERDAFARELDALLGSTGPQANSTAKEAEHHA